MTCTMVYFDKILDQFTLHDMRCGILQAAPGECFEPLRELENGREGKCFGKI